MANMVKPKLITDLREIFIIQTLLNCNKKKTIDIIQIVNNLTDSYFKNHPQDKPRKELTNKTISPILKGLHEDEEIIGREQVPEEEHQGQGQGGFRYWLLDDNRAFVKAYVKLDKIKRYSTNYFIQIGNEFINSHYGALFLNEDLFYMFEYLKGEIDPSIKEYILKVVKLSPSALYRLLFDFAILYNEKKSNTPTQDAINSILGRVTNGLLEDVLYNAYSSPIDFELKNTILVKEKNDNQVWLISVDTKNLNQKRTNYISRATHPLLDGNRELPSYNELVKANTTLQQIIQISDKILNENPEYKKLLEEKINQNEKKTELKKILNKINNQSKENISPLTL
jgi:hypothetical protein